MLPVANISRIVLLAMQTIWTHALLLAPEWEARFEPGLEWAEVAPVASPHLAIAIRDGRLQLLSMPNGWPMLEPALAVGRGVRLAATAPADRAAIQSGPIYLFDRQAIHALASSPKPRLLWRFGDPPSGQATSFPADPELLPAWVAVGANPKIVLALRSDGQCCVLDALTGRLVHREDIGPAPVARAHADADTACVLCKAAGRVQAVFWEGGLDPIQLKRVELGRTWPAWSELNGDVLITLDDARVSLWTTAGRQQTHDLGADDPAARAVALLPDAKQAALLVGTGREVRALDLAQGRALWTSGVHPEPIRSVRVEADAVLAVGEHVASAFDAHSGALLARCAPPGDISLLSASISSMWLWAVYGPAPAPAVAGFVYLHGAANGANAAQPSPAVGVFRISVDRVPQAVLWTQTHTVLQFPGHLAAYRLPWTTPPWHHWLSSEGRE